MQEQIPCPLSQHKSSSDQMTTAYSNRPTKAYELLNFSTEDKTPLTVVATFPVQTTSHDRLHNSKPVISSLIIGHGSLDRQSTNRYLKYLAYTLPTRRLTTSSDRIIPVEDCSLAGLNKAMGPCYSCTGIIEITAQMLHDNKVLKDIVQLVVKGSVLGGQRRLLFGNAFQNDKNDENYRQGSFKTFLAVSELGTKGQWSEPVVHWLKTWSKCFDFYIYKDNFYSANFSFRLLTSLDLKIIKQELQADPKDKKEEPSYDMYPPVDIEAKFKHYHGSGREQYMGLIHYWKNKAYYVSNHTPYNNWKLAELNLDTNKLTIFENLKTGFHIESIKIIGDDLYALEATGVLTMLRLHTNRDPEIILQEYLTETCKEKLDKIYARNPLPEWDPTDSHIGYGPFSMLEGGGDLLFYYYDDHIYVHNRFSLKQISKTLVKKDLEKPPCFLRLLTNYRSGYSVLAVQGYSLGQTVSLPVMFFNIDKSRRDHEEGMLVSIGTITFTDLSQIYQLSVLGRNIVACVRQIPGKSQQSANEVEPKPSEHKTNVIRVFNLNLC